jgi:hypothetical protein
MQDAPRFDHVVDHQEFDYHRAMMQRESRPRSSRLRPAMFAALALVLAVLGVGLTGFMDDSPSRSERGIATNPVREAPATAPVASPPTAPPPVAVVTKEPPIAPDAPQPSPPRVVAEEQAKQESSGILPTPAPTPPKALATEPAPSAQPASLVARAPEQPASASVAPAPELPQAMQATPAAVPDQQRDEGTARVIVSVSPRGEIYIDGEHHGTTPPMTTFDLKPGMHRIEVRSGSRKPYLTYMTLQAGDVRRIRHDFDAKPSGPPS